MSARDIGAQWEVAAARHLEQAGLRTLQRNFSCRLGEIDLIMADARPRDGESTVFVEVRFRSSHAHGDGVDSVGAAKRAKLLRTAQVWLQAHPQRASQACRFDVVACSGSPHAPCFEWIRNAFEYEASATR